MKLIPLLAACVIVVGSGVIHGLMIDRWGSSDDLNRAAACLRQIPDEIGSWKKSHEFTIPDTVLEIGEIDGYLSRVYTNPADGSSVNLMIVCGRPGPISVHTPDICFRGAGYQLVSQYQRHEFSSEGESGEKVECFFADFTKPDAASLHSTRVFWTWTDGNLFFAPDNPRVAFAGKPFLYKIYVTRPTERVNDPPEADPCVAFLKVAMPVLHDSIVSGTDVKEVSKVTNP